MMNIGNLGSKESIGVKYKDGTYALLCLKLWFESDWYFCNITESGWFCYMDEHNVCSVTSEPSQSSSGEVTAHLYGEKQSF